MTRPKDSVQHPDLDKAWAVYEAALAKSTEGVRAAITKQFDMAAAKGDLDAAEKWRKAIDSFEKDGEIPADSETRAAVMGALAGYKKANEQLTTAYETVVKLLTTQKNLDEARVVKNEALALGGNEVPGPPPLPKPKPDAGMVDVQGGRLPRQSALAGINVLPFKIARTETTWREWLEVRDFAVKNGFDLGGAGHGDGDHFPARGISWFAAVKWCNAKSLREKFRPVYLAGGVPFCSGEVVPVVDPDADGYRLPTDAEWEWAATGGVRSKGSEFSGGNDLNAVAWFAGNNVPNGPKPVGTKIPNELGLYDMTGNVWEWCWDAAPPNERRRFRSASYDDPRDALGVRRQHSTWPGNNGEDIGFRYARNAGQVRPGQGSVRP